MSAGTSQPPTHSTTPIRVLSEDVYGDSYCQIFTTTTIYDNDNDNDYDNDNGNDNDNENYDDKDNDDNKDENIEDNIDKD